MGADSVPATSFPLPELRLLAKLPIGPMAGCAVFGVLIFASYILTMVLGAAILGELTWAPEKLIHFGTLSAAVIAAIASVTLYAGYYRTVRVWVDLSEIERAYGRPTAQQILNAQMQAATSAWRPTLIGAVIGLAIIAVLHPFVPDLLLGRMFEPDALWKTIAMPLVIGFIARDMHQTGILIGILSREISHGLALNLMNLEPLGGLARIGLHSALYTILALTIASLTFVDPSVDAALLLPIFLLIGGAAGVGLWQVMTPVHREIVRTKRAELERLSREIDGDIASVRNNGDDFEIASKRLPGLLNYRQQVENVREWPADTGTYARMAIYLLIPLGSWFGGAIVERLLGLILD